MRGTDRLYRTTDRCFDVVQCSGCKLARLYPWPAESELPRYYPADYWFEPKGSFAERLEESYRRLVLRDHIAFVRRALAEAPAGRVLDVGCGGGLFLRMLAERGHAVAGLDFSANAARTAWQHNRVPVVCANMTRDPFPPGSFSAVTMFHVLEHLPDPVGYVEAARQALKPDGRFIVQVPNASSWQFRLFGAAWNGIDIPRHLINYRESDLVALVEDCGFEVVRRKRFSLRDNPAGFATSVAPGLDPMARRMRGKRGGGATLLKDGVYFGLTLAALPFTVLEAACGAGSTIMIEARKR